MIILGIDPAISHIGWGIITSIGSQIKYIASGVIDTNATDELPIRLAFISYKIEAIIDEFKPDIIAMEEVFINKNPLSSLKLSHARGAIMAMVGRSNIPMEEYAPNKVKKTLVGAGRAEKEQVLHMVNIIMPTAKIKKLDESDALAVAYTCSVYAAHRKITAK
jgi:crossover junction endodeoxyribonuclease RuvC